MANGGYTGALPIRDDSPEAYSGVWDSQEQYAEVAAGRWAQQTTGLAPRSVRLNSADSAYFTRAFSTPSSTRTWTWAGWVKRVKTASVSDVLLSANYGSGLDARISFYLDNTFYYADSVASLQTTAVYRDFSSWMHICFVYDSTNGTSTERLRLYVNGVRITTGNGLGSTSYPSLNAASNINAAQLHKIGDFATVTGYYANLYLASIYFIDGQALEPEAFGFFDGAGIWQPRRYRGTYGTNGFHLDFADNSSAAALGTDTSGNGNTWTVNNISVAAGSGNDSLVDTPTNYGTDTSVGGEVRGNYATLNPINSVNSTLTNGNLDATISISPSTSIAVGSIAVTTGKWYWEVVSADTGEIRGLVGVCDVNASSRTYTSANGWGYWNLDGNKYTNNTGQAYGATWTNGDVIGVALDMDGNSLTFYKNGVSQGVAYSSVFTGKTISPALFNPAGASSRTYTINFGQRPFAYAAPSGFKALCTTNLPDPVVAQPSTVMDVALYTGTGSNLAVTGLNFSPDLIWTKARSAVDNHILVDQIRGVGNILLSNSTQAESAYSAFVSFDSNGFTKAAAESVSGRTYVAWTWDAGSSTVTLNPGDPGAGSITSQVRANPSAGFSIATWTGVGGTSTVGHGLGVAPAFWIIKPRTEANNWNTYHSSLATNYMVWLNLTSAATSYTMGSSSVAPTSSVVTVKGDSSGWDNKSGVGYVMYAFAPVVGYSSFGSYTGNGSADGPFVFCNFRPRWILVKSTGATGWAILDTGRNSFNQANSQLFPHGPDAELTSATDYFNADILSNGFKLRSASSPSNTNGQTYLYCAFAENPFKYARAR